MTKLAAILRVADGLDRSHTSAILDIKCKRTTRGLTIHLQPANGTSVEMEIWGADRKKDLFEETFKTDVRFLTR